MNENKLYSLPKLPYGYDEFSPILSKDQLQIHHEKHHMAYVNGANAILEKMDAAHKNNEKLDMKALLKDLSFQIGGHLMHSLFWRNIMPPSKAKKLPEGLIMEKLVEEFGSFERFKELFQQTAMSVEGSGWAALTYCLQTQRPILMQVEKHNMHVYPMFRILMVVDVFEHAYYIDYKNNRAAFLDAFWGMVNWDEVNHRLENLLK
jgi:superoxide dismutase, Fe-Mn family